MNNNNILVNESDSLNELLSLPVNFVVDPLITDNVKRDSVDIEHNSFGSVKKSRLSLDDKDQKTKERILRNRAAAQDSRDKKRKYVAELENQNKKLVEDQEKMNKRMKQLEEQNNILQSQLEAFTRQMATLQAQIKFNAFTPILFNNFCDSARIAKRKQHEIMNIFSSLFFSKNNII